MTKVKPDKTRITLALVTVQLLFGINYVASKLIVKILPPLLWASVRVLVSGVVLFAITSSTGRKSPPWKREYFLPLTLFAFLGIIVSQGSFLLGLHYTTATNSAVLTTLIPIFTLLFITLFGKERLTGRRGLGFAFALAGVLVMKRIENFSFSLSGSGNTLLGDGLTVLNCLSYGLFLTLSKKFIEKHDPLWTTTWLFLVGGVGLTILATPDWLHFQAPALNFQLVACMIFTIFGSTLLAYFLNNWALGRTKTSSVALYIYLQPVIASLLAWAFLDEVVSLRTLVSIALIFIGMLLAR